VEVPPLRKRSEDIPILTDYFADKYCSEQNKCHLMLSDNTKTIFACYHWPRNVGELEIYVKRIIMTGKQENITSRLVDTCKKQSSSAKINTFLDARNFSDLANPKTVRKYLIDLNKISLKGICSEFLEQTEKAVMKKALEKTNWNRKKAAMLLDISYKSMLNKIKAYKLA